MEWDDFLDALIPNRREQREADRAIRSQAMDEADRLREQAKNKGVSDADFRKQIARQPIIKARTDANLAEIEQLKNADNKQKELNKAELAKFKQGTLDKIEAMKANAAIDDAPRGEKAALRGELAAKIKAYRAQRKTALDKLRADGKAKAIAVKQGAKKYADDLRKENNSLNSGFSTISGFYTDANGRKRPITAQGK
jgi:hypothetical protein